MFDQFSWKRPDHTQEAEQILDLLLSSLGEIRKAFADNGKKGLIALGLGDYKTAADMLSQAFDDYSVQNASKVNLAIFAKGAFIAFDAIGDKIRAREFQDKARELSQELSDGDILEYVTFLRAVAGGLAVKRSVEKALALLDESYELSERIQGERGKLVKFNVLMLQYQLLEISEEMGEAIDALNEAICLANEIEATYSLEISQTFEALARKHQFEEKFEFAEGMWREAIRFAEVGQRQDPQRVLRLRLKLSSVLGSEGKWEEAERFVDGVIEGCVGKDELREILLQAIYTKAYQIMSRGEPLRGYLFFKRWFGQMDLEGREAFLHYANLARMALICGKGKDAENWLVKALSADSLGNRERAEVLLIRAGIDLSRRRFGEALDKLNLLKKKFGQFGLEPQLSINRCQALIGLERNKEALAVINKAADWIVDRGVSSHPSDYIVAHLLKGRILAEMDQLPQSQEAFSEAYRFFLETPSMDDLMIKPMLFANLGEFYLRLWDVYGDESYMRQSVEYLEEAEKAIEAQGWTCLEMAHTVYEMLEFGYERLGRVKDAKRIELKRLLAKIEKHGE